MIPKIIHYCWFGKGTKSKIILKCIDSWKKYCPDYQIIEWNETNFDINQNQYVKEAYDKQKWAFVSDFARLKALYEYGGVYVDTDCEILQNIDSFLEEGGVVTGYQEEVSIPAAIMFAEKGNEWIKNMVEYYDDKHFLLPDGKCNLTTNSTIITVLSIKRFGFNIGDNNISFGNVKLYPTVYFAPVARNKKNNIDGDLKAFDIDPKLSFAVHHGTASWYKKTFKNKIKAGFVGILRFFLGHKHYSKMKAKILKRRYIKSEIE